MSNTASEQTERYLRELVEQQGRWLIKSTCRDCGAVIVGSMMERLADDEERHLRQCSPPGQREQPSDNPGRSASGT